MPPGAPQVPCCQAIDGPVTDGCRLCAGRVYETIRPCRTRVASARSTPTSPHCRQASGCMSTSTGASPTVGHLSPVGWSSHRAVRCRRSTSSTSTRLGSYVRRASPSAGSRLREDLRDVVLGTPRGTDTSTSTLCRGCLGSVRPSAPPRLSGSSRRRRRSACQRTSPSGWPRRSGGRWKGSRHSPARGQAVGLS